LNTIVTSVKDQVGTYVLKNSDFHCLDPQQTEEKRHLHDEVKCEFLLISVYFFILLIHCRL